MTTPADRAHQSPLETVLLDVQATLSELLVAADEQYAAIVARDTERLESVTRQQERLSARLARAEARRIELTNTSVAEASVAPAAALTGSIGTAVRQLKERQSLTAGLLQQNIDLTNQTLTFLQRLVAPQISVYGARGVAASGKQSLLVDSRA